MAWPFLFKIMLHYHSCTSRLLLYTFQVRVVKNVTKCDEYMNKYNTLCVRFVSNSIFYVFLYSVVLFGFGFRMEWKAKTK